MNADALAWLRVGLLFCGPDWRPNIEARIAALTSEIPQERSGTARKAPSTGMRDGVLGEPGAIGVQPAAPHQKEPAVAPVVERPAGSASLQSWRAARKALRQAGHDVQQVDGVVYVDGKRSDDPALYPDDGDQDTRL